MVEQILNSCGVAYFWRGQFTCQDLVVFIDRQMQLAPGATGRNIVFFLMPFVFPIDLEPGGVESTMIILPGSTALAGRCRGKVMQRLEMLLKSGMVISAFMIRASDFMKPSVWRSGR